MGPTHKLSPPEDQPVDEQTPLLREQQPEPEASNGDVTQNSESTTATENPHGYSTARIWIILLSCWVGVFLQAMDSTIMATLSTPISTEFDSFALYSWLVTAYLIANAALMPLSGKLTDIYGRRIGLMLSILSFLAGNLICGLAKTEWMMIVGRIVQGLGGGCLNTISTFICTDLVPLRKRGMYQGFGNMAFGAGAGLGGVFGGWMNDVYNWRMAFLIQVPFLVIAGIIIFFTVRLPVKETDTAKINRVDFVGSALLILSVVLMLLGLNSGGTIVPWNHPLVYISLPLSAVGLAGFIYYEDQIASEPIIPPRLILVRTVGCACLTNWFGSMTYYSITYFGPLYFQVRGESTTAAGTRLIPSAIGTAIGSLGKGSGFIIRLTGEYRILNIATQVLFLGGISCLIPFLTKIGTPVWIPYIVFLATGTAYGSLLTITLLAIISAVEHKHQAVVTSASYAFRSTGGTIGIAVVTAVFQNLFRDRLPQRLGCGEGGLSPEECAKIVDDLTRRIGSISKEKASIREPAQLAFGDAITGVWGTTLGLAAMAALMSLFMRQHMLYSTIDRK